MDAIERLGVWVVVGVLGHFLFSTLVDSVSQSIAAAPFNQSLSKSKTDETHQSTLDAQGGRIFHSWG